MTNPLHKNAHLVDMFDCFQQFLMHYSWHVVMKYYPHHIMSCIPWPWPKGAQPQPFPQAVSAPQRSHVTYMGVEPKIGFFYPKSSILIGISIIFTIHFGGTSIFGNTHISSKIIIKWEIIYPYTVDIKMKCAAYDNSRPSWALQGSRRCHSQTPTHVDPLELVDPSGRGVQGEGVFLGNPKDSVWEDGGTLGNIRED